jgi:hypothetical protein
VVARDGSDEPPGPGQGRNPEVNFRGKKRSNTTHVSRTDPDALLATKNTGVAYLSFTTHTLSENRHGLIVDVHTTQATGTAEREAAKVMMPVVPEEAAGVSRERLAGSGRARPVAGRPGDQVGVTLFATTTVPVL